MERQIECLDAARGALLTVDRDGKPAFDETIRGALTEAELETIERRIAFIRQRLARVALGL